MIFQIKNNIISINFSYVFGRFIEDYARIGGKKIIIIY